MALTVGPFSKWAVGEYSRRSRVGLSTSMRASPDRTSADWWATPLAMFTGVERLTGEVATRGGAVVGDGLPQDARASATPTRTGITAGMTPRWSLRSGRRLTRGHSIGGGPSGLGFGDARQPADS